MTEHLEIEQKFEVGTDYDRPEFGGLRGYTAAAPVRYHLSATYFDTADTRLARHKITLRRRTGGSDAGWHLKLPAGQDTRRELHEPLGDSPPDEVPRQLAEQVAEVTGGLPLAPIAQLDTERTVVTLTSHDDRVAAEIADDVVTARRLAVTPGTGSPGTGTPSTAGSPSAGSTLRWREIEVEVPSPSPVQGAVAELLREAGARPAGQWSKLDRVLNG
jgi:hypothetical protein